ncbi:sensor domain-containing phosphodiesterase [Oceanospirillum maris]|uniref:sensor domain-containing phosphodiesterase n=1 Tax=Oceanospirillum maris TaxID=64977 RepID=UPI00041AE795|nr:EAL domain-containing protein [Oceanospirillum maris]
MSSSLTTPLALYDLPTPALQISLDGVCTHFNAAAKTLAEELGFDNFCDLLPHELQPLLFQRQPELGVYSDTLYDNAQSYRWQYIATQDNAFILQAYNLTDRENYRAILENSVDGIYKTNRAGQLIYANQALASTFGYDNPQHMCDAIEQLSEDLYDNATDRETFLQHLKRFGEVRGMECQMKRVDGSLIWIRINGRALKDQNGSIQAIIGTVYDISAQKTAETAMATAEEKFRSIFENSMTGLHQSTLDGRYLNVNPALARILGYSSPADCLEAISHIGKQVYVRPHEWLKAMKRLRKEGYFTLNEVELYTRAGTKRWATVSNRLVPASDTIPEHIEGSVVDITDGKRAQERIKYLAHYDSLTTLPNRVFFHNELGRLVEDVDDGHLKSIALIVLDLDNFKDINDTQGHLTGDMLLIKTAHRLQDFFGHRAQFFRLGGDEFAITINNIADREKIAAQIRELTQILAEPVAFDTTEISCTVSAGIALYPEAKDVIQEGDVQQQLFRYADLALYRSKSNGRNRHTFFAIEMQLEVLKEQQIEKELREAIEHNELVLYYQPLLKADTEQLIGAEVLVRWQHPERGLIPPFEFIPIAEKTGLISRVDDWVLLRSAQQLQLWFSQDKNLPQLSVNISAHRLNQRDFAQYVQQVIQRTGIPASSLCLEITEQNMITSFESVRNTLNLLRNMGVKIALDDFGTGYSSLSYLKQLPVDKLKVDRSFVMEMHEDPQDRAIIKTILELGHGLGIWVNAEGVENEVQIRMLRELGIDEFQGFFFSRPLPLDDFIARYMQEAPTVA